MFRLLTIVIALAWMKSVECLSVQHIGSFNAFQKIEAEDCSFLSNSQIVQACGDEPTTVYLGGNNPPTYPAYYSVDFGNGAVRVEMRLATPLSADQDGYVYIRLDSEDSTPIASYHLASTGGYCHWTVVSTYLQTIPLGLHDLYLTFLHTDYGHTVDIDWFNFYATSGNQSNFQAFEIIQAEDFNYTKVAGPEVCPGSSVSYMGSLNTDTIIAYYGVNFGMGAQMVQLRIAAWDQGSIFLHLDSALNPPFAYIPVQKIGSDVDVCNFNSIDQFVTTTPTGVHDLYFTVQSPIGVETFVSIDWFTFKTTIP